MILICSAGHITDTRWVSVTGSMYKKPGDKCGQLISYDRMDGGKYCQRRLREKMSELDQIRKLLDTVDRQLNAPKGQEGLQVDYLLKRLANLESHLDLVVNGSVKGGYKDHCSYALGVLHTLRLEMETWKQGVPPDGVSQ